MCYLCSMLKLSDAKNVLKSLEYFRKKLTFFEKIMLTLNFVSSNIELDAGIAQR